MRNFSFSTMSTTLMFLLFSASPTVHAQQPASTPEGKRTYLVVYKPGPGWLPGKSLQEQPLKEHGRYILSLYAKGALKSAGPFSDGAGGAAVFEAASEADAKAVVAADPAVVSQIFIADLHPWGLVDWERMIKK